MPKGTIARAAGIMLVTIVAFALWDFVIRDAILPQK